MYFTRKDIIDSSNPTGFKYKFAGYLILDYFITDEYGNLTTNFEANSIYHVLWKTTQRIQSSNDGPLKTSTFDVNTSSPAYDIDYPEQTIDVFGEWKRLPTGNTFLPTGNYIALIILTEESFHGDGGTFAGNWAAAMETTINFILI